MSFVTTLNIAQILVSVVLSVVLILQAKGSGFGAGLGGSTSTFRTRRGVEKTLFQLTIVLVVLFIVISLISVVAARK
ncbi:MAG: preprotein translocase subunit SecG [Dehalococcoidia bacterium]